MIEATVRIWVTGEDDDMVDNVLRAMRAAADEYGPFGTNIVMHEQSRREVEQ